MKIYQIHEYGGEWEDAFDYIVGSYISYDKANAELKRLIKEEENIRKCDDCPLFTCEWNCDDDCEECIEYLANRAKEYCDRYEPFDKNKHSEEDYDDEKCVNWEIRLYSNYYRIEEVEVIE